MSEEEVKPYLDKIRKKLDLADNYILLKDYDNAGIELFCGYIEYYNVIKMFPSLRKYLRSDTK